MPPFRIVARHPDRGHHDHGWAQVGATFDSAEDAQQRLADAHRQERAAPRSLALHERVVHDPLGSFHNFGYEAKVQELVASKTEDRGGFPVEVEHTWKDVKSETKGD